MLGGAAQGGRRTSVNLCMCVDGIWLVSTSSSQYTALLVYLYICSVSDVWPVFMLDGAVLYVYL